VVDNGLSFCLRKHVHHLGGVRNQTHGSCAFGDCILVNARRNCHRFDAAGSKQS
jgi:hypothetical protein